MSQMNPSEARAIDPILTAVARGYISVGAPAAQALFPLVPVAARGGKIITFGPDAFRLMSTTRAPGANTKRVQFPYGTESFALTDHSLEGVVPRELQEEAAVVPGIDQGSNAIRKVQEIMALEREKQAADLATDASKYASSNKKTLSAGGQWSHDDSEPDVDIMKAKEAIREQTGVRPNTLVLGPKVLSALKVNKALIDKISSADDKVLRTEQIARFLDVEKIVEASAVHHDGSKFVDLWGKFAVLAYTAPRTLQEMGSPSYGYTYQLTGYPIVEEPYTERNPKSWFYPVTDAYQAVLAGASAGYLFSAVVA